MEWKRELKKRKADIEEKRRIYKETGRGEFQHFKDTEREKEGGIFKRRKNDFLN